MRVGGGVGVVVDVHDDIIVWVIADVHDGSAVTYTHFAWDGGTFFPVVLLCCIVLVFGSGGNKVLIYIRMYYLEYNTVLVVC